MKWLKWTAVAVVAIGLLLEAYLWFWFDLNDVKTKLQTVVQQQTGRNLQIEGALGWSLYPQLGLSFEQASLSNPEGFTPATMLQIEHAVAKVAFWPLLQQQIQIQQLSVNGLVLNWVSKKDGRSSLAGLTGSAVKDQAAIKPAGVNPDINATSATSMQGLQLQQLELTDVVLNLLNEGQPPQQLALKSLSLKNWQAGQWAELTAELQTKVAEKALQSTVAMRLKLSADSSADHSNIQLADLVIQGDLAKQAFQLQAQGQWLNNTQQLQLELTQLQFADSAASGNLQLNNSGKLPQLNANLKFDQLDLRPWQTPANAAVKASSQAAIEPDLSALRQFDAKLALTVAHLQTNTLIAENVQLTINNQHGLVALDLAKANLLQGQINATAQLDGRKPVPTYQFQAKLTQLQIQPLLVALADFDKLSGRADLTVTGQGRSLLPAQLQQLMTAKGQFQIVDGAIVGANVAQMIRQFRATIKGGDSSEAEELGNPQQTDFTSLTGQFSLADGVLQQSDLQLASPLLRLSGAGQLQLTEQQLDYRLNTALVNSLKGQGGLAKDQLASVDIPLRIHGDIANPKYQLDTKALYKNELKQKVDETKQDLKQKLADKLREKFGG